MPDTVEEMKHRIRGAAGLFMLWLASSIATWAEAPAAAVAAFNAYAGNVEARLQRQHRSQPDFVANLGSGSETEARLRRGEVILEKLTPEGDGPQGAMLHDWRGTAFVPGATVAGFERVMKDVGSYPLVFAQQVVQARILAAQAEANPDHFTATMRVRQKHVITVVMDTTYDIMYGRLDAEHGYSISRSTKITEIADQGTAKERALGPSEDHGFLWRLNTYWSYEERDGDLYMQIESISLTRGIPTGLGWAVRPYVESVPRESLEFTLRATYKALQKQQGIERK